MHADPHPGNFMLLPDGRVGVLDFGAVKRLPGGIPAPLGRNAALVLGGREVELRATMVELGFLPDAAPVTAQDLADYCSSVSEPFRHDTFTFTRSWLRTEAVKLANPRSSTHTAAKHLTLPPEYLMIHRVALGMIGLLCQLEATVPTRHLEMRWSPGFRATIAEGLGVSADSLLAQSSALLEARYGTFSEPVPAQRRTRSKKVTA